MGSDLQDAQDGRLPVKDGPFEFDLAKNEINRQKHGVGLDDFLGFDAIVTIVPDTRSDDGEDRYSAFGMIRGGAYNLVFTPRNDSLRLISFRRAHQEELDYHEGKSDRSRQPDLDS